MFRNILIPLDGSTFGDRVLAFAADLAAPSSARVTLLMVVQQSRDSPGLDGAKAYLSERQASLASSGLGDVGVEVREGDPVLAILETAREVNADLIAMTTRGAGATGEEGLGSVAVGVAGVAPCPVFMVRVPRPEPPQTLAEERWQSEGGANVG